MKPRIHITEKESIFMKEKRAMIKPVAEFLTYKIRSGEISSEGGDKIWRIALDKAEKVDAIIGILEMDLPEADTITKIERL